MNKIKSYKKNIFSYILIFSVCCMSLFFYGCSDGSTGESSASEDSGSSSTVENPITGRSYVPAELPGNFGKLLSAKITNKTSTYDSSCTNFFVTDDFIKNDDSNLTNFKQMIKHLLSGKTVIFVRPTYKALESVDLGIAIISGYTTEEFKKMLPDLDVFSNDAYSYLCQISDSTDRFFSVSGEDKGDTPVYDAFAIRGPDLRYIDNIEERVKEQNSEIQVTDDFYELFLPDFAKWVNNYSSSSSTRLAFVSKKDSNMEVEKSQYAKTVTNSFIALGPSKNSYPAKMAVDITTTYWAFSPNSGDDNNPVYNKDYLLFEQEVKYHNEKLYCNDSPKNNCWDLSYGNGWIYGPFFYNAAIQNDLKGETPSISDASPLTEANTTTYKDGIDFNIDPCKMAVNTSGFSVGASLSCSFSCSTTTVVHDLTTKYGAINSAYPQWIWTGNTPYTINDGHGRYNTHTQAPLLLRKTLVVHPSWKWEVNDAKDKESYTLQTAGYVNLKMLVRNEYSAVTRLSSFSFEIPVAAPVRYSKPVRLNVDWTNKSQEEAASVEQILETAVDSYCPEYVIWTRNNTETEIQNMAEVFARKLEKQIRAQKKALRQKNFDKLGKLTFSIKDDAAGKTITSFTVDFSDY